MSDIQHSKEEIIKLKNIVMEIGKIKMGLMHGWNKSDLTIAQQKIQLVIDDLCKQLGKEIVSN